MFVMDYLSRCRNIAHWAVHLHHVLGLFKVNEGEKLGDIKNMNFSNGSALACIIIFMCAL